MKTKTSQQNSNYQLAIIIGIIFIAIDQIIKFLINRNWPEISSRNTGIIFGFIDNNLWTIVFLALGFLILFYLIRDWKEINKISQLGLILIISGAVSNVVDRISYGGAIDYFHFQFWSSFNLADVYIVSGIILYGWQLLIKPAKN